MELIALLLIVFVLVVTEQVIFSKLVLKNVEYTVRFSTDEAFEGDTIEIIEEVVNRKWLPVPWLKTELSTSRWLEFTGSVAARGSDARFVPSIFALKPYERCVRTRKAVAAKRGIFELESSSLIGSDLLGMVSVSRNIAVNQSIRILPVPYEVSDGELSERELYGEIAARRFICDDPFMRSGTQEYTGREPMNMINWKISARQSRLMVYRNDFSTTNRVLLLINLQKSGKILRPPTLADTETMIKAAAFVLNVFSDKGIRVDFATNGSGKMYISGESDTEGYLKILRGFSEMENICETDFFDMYEAIPKSDFTDIIIFTPYLDEHIYAIGESEKRNGRNVVFYCGGDISDISGVIPIGRLHRYVFVNN